MEWVFGLLFVSENDEGDFVSGMIYVLCSKLEYFVVLVNWEVFYKIGVIGGDVLCCIVGVKLDLIFLMVDVEIVVSYDFYNINCLWFENIIYCVFGLV